MKQSIVGSVAQLADQSGLRPGVKHLKRAVLDDGRAAELSRELRCGVDGFLAQRRAIVGLSLAAIGVMGLISLYQVGVVRHLPNPPLPGLDSDRVDASPEAYKRLATPDAVLGLGSFAMTMGLAEMGGKDRARRQPWIPLALGGKVIGVVDLLGRDGTQDFVTKLLKTPDLKLKRVTKMEDLLPLLQFSAADAVLVPAASVKSVTERSRLPLKVRELPDAHVGLLAVGILNGKVRYLAIKQIQALDGDTNRTLGVERWRVH